ncbi:RNA methyltransferase, TrmH family [Indibacter alkaliphilus LW1]|uniref:RNA methyltransferase, TrmH family n=1 Tax=Indibacter alkaliphilus (strain CCUG 57479 / KCTC 22604 / LW1) TaxID=1189612 RepID=S2DHW9_INDAL|nr:RNA methyltransferase [Indibacter alkaliphilus]EOZ98549.1 RNA methyltransferase, TrmH family [Indibacter alkaliphilus LW1]
MLSKNTLKFIKSLQQKKFRRLEGSFFVEGTKNVTELLLSDFVSTHLLYTEKFYSQHQALVDNFRGESFAVTQKVLESAGAFKSNDSALAVAKLKDNKAFAIHDSDWVIALDDVRDPGNLGTIIRIADWYGIEKLVLSEESAEFYNPKVLQASMGSFSRIQCFYTDLKLFLCESKIPIYGAFLDGTSIYHTKFEKGGILLMGNESNGISPEIEQMVNQKVTIPRFGHAESLNVAVATAIFCDNIKRSK